MQACLAVDTANLVFRLQHRLSGFLSGSIRRCHTRVGNSRTRLTLPSNFKGAHTLRALLILRPQSVLTGSHCRLKLFGACCSIIRGVFLAKLLPGGSNSEGLQVSMCLPTDRNFDTWPGMKQYMDCQLRGQMRLLQEDLCQSSPCPACPVVSSWSECLRCGGNLTQWHILRHHLWNRGPTI